MSSGAARQIDDQLWAAIGDPTRRTVIDLLLTDGEHTATTLSTQLPVTRQAVAKHLDVLDRAGLVHATVAGREKFYRVDEAHLADAVGYNDPEGSLKAHLKGPQKNPGAYTQVFNEVFGA